MKTKQQAIQEAYGEYWDTFNETSKKCAFKHDGFIASILEHRLQEIETEYSDEKRAWRPKSLQGIENNNYWIRVESEKDLPKDIALCFIVIKDTLIINTPVFYNPTSKTFCINNLEQPWSTATHYQQIEKPKPPIY